MELLGRLNENQLISISNDFQYVDFIREENLIGLKLFPFSATKTESLKLKMLKMAKNHKIPTIALVHALDTEARIGDRPEYEEIKNEMFLVKEKINIGESLLKKIREAGLPREEQAILYEIYDDVSNLISKVIYRFNVMALELIGTGKISINENGAKKPVNFGLSDDHKIAVKGWSDKTHGILDDITQIKQNAPRIKRALTSPKVMKYLLKNEAIMKNASDLKQYPTQDWLINFFEATFGFRITVIEGQYRLSYHDDKKYNLFPDNAISFLETDGVFGETVMAYTGEEDFGLAERVEGYVAVTQYVEQDPPGLWTKASAIGLPVPYDIDALWVCTVGD